MNHERYEGGSEAAELADFERLARDLVKVQERNGAAAAGPEWIGYSTPRPRWGCATPGSRSTRSCRSSCGRAASSPGAVLDATVRLSNASGTHQPDAAEGHARHRAAASRPATEHVHDLLTTNYEVSPAANAHEFVAMAMALAGVPDVAGR